jgi:drug/metabolite transporter (DMT)-like permease
VSDLHATVAHPRADVLTLGAFATVVLLGGANFVAVRFSNQELPPFWGAGLRFGAAALLLFAAVALGHLPLPHGRALTGALVYGVLGFGVTYAIGYWAMQRVPAGMAAVVLASAPLFTVFFAWAHGLQRVHLRDVAGAAVALLGIGIIFRTSAGGSLPPLPLLGMLVMAACFAEAMVIAKRFPKSHPVSTNAVAMAVGAVLLILVSTVLGETRAVPMRTPTWIALGYLVVLGSTVAFVLYLYVLRRWSAPAAANQFVLFPLVAIALAAWLEGAPVTGPLLLGAGVVLSGVYLGVVSQPVAHRPCPGMGSEPCLTSSD